MESLIVQWDTTDLTMTPNFISALQASAWIPALRSNRGIRCSDSDKKPHDSLPEKLTIWHWQPKLFRHSQRLATDWIMRGSPAAALLDKSTENFFHECFECYAHNSSHFLGQKATNKRGLTQTALPGSFLLIFAKNMTQDAVH